MEFDEEDYQAKTEPIYKIYHMNEAETKMNDKIKSLQDFLLLNHDSVLLLLLYFNWNEDKLQQTWSDSKTNLKELSSRAGIPHTSVLIASSVCPICAEKLLARLILPCGHQACINCVRGLICSGSNSGKIVFDCWECSSKITNTIIKTCLQKQEYDKYRKALMRSYTTESKVIRWCPNKKGCDYYAEFPDMVSQEISCYCGYNYCFK